MFIWAMTLDIAPDKFFWGALFNQEVLIFFLFLHKKQCSPDERALLGTVWLVSTLFAQVSLTELSFNI